jgi:hypothetical protein
MSPAVPPVRQLLAARLDVVEMRHDHRVAGQHRLAGAQLPGNRQRGVLLVIRRGAARKGGPQDPGDRPRPVAGSARPLEPPYPAGACPVTDCLRAIHPSTSRITIACSQASCWPARPAGGSSGPTR